MKRIGCLLQRLAVQRSWCGTSIRVALSCLGSFLLIPTQMATAETQGEAIVAAAASKAGVPYCEPGGSLNGPTPCGGKPATFDCSGLAMYAVYQGTGGRVALPHGAGMDHVSGGVAVSRANLQPGDLVFFGPGFNGADFHHVGIYAGVVNGQEMMWDANTAFWIYGDGVQLRSLAAIEKELGFDRAVRYWSGSADGGGLGEGSFVSNDGYVYRIAGGAPIYVGNWNAVGGPQPTTSLSDAEFAALPQYPRDGTQLDSSNGGVYIVAGGAPMYLSNWAAIGGPHPGVGVDGWDIEHPDNPAAHLRPYPADGTFLNTSAGHVYRVAGGAAIPVTTWSLFSGVQPYTTIDQWDVGNPGNPAAHLRPYPADGTLVEGLPSTTYWSFEGGLRTQVSANPAAIGIDDFGLAVFPIRSTPVAGASGQGTTVAGRSGVSAAERQGGVKGKRKACHKIANRRNRARCVSAAKHRRAHGRARKPQGSRTASERPINASAGAASGREVEMRLGSGLVRCPTPADAIDGGGFGNLQPLLVRRVSCDIGLKVATKRQCAAHRRCTVAEVDWTCRYKAIAVETVRGRCRARAGRRVRWIAGGAE